MNGQQTRRTLTLLIITPGELRLNITRHFIPSPRTLMYTEESLAVNMGQAAAGLNQQGHTALHKKTPQIRPACR